jgi:DNA-binding PadR family transcriptional regulator
MSQPHFLPPPLATHEFYILLALHDGGSHIYQLRDCIANLSLKSIKISISTLYSTVTRMHAQGLVDLIDTRPSGASQKPRLHYEVSAEGNIRLQEELLRMQHAVKIGESGGLLANEVPTDIQRLLLNVKVGAKGL